MIPSNRPTVRQYRDHHFSLENHFALSDFEKWKLTDGRRVKTVIWPWLCVGLVDQKCFKICYVAAYQLFCYWFQFRWHHPVSKLQSRHTRLHPGKPKQSLHPSHTGFCVQSTRRLFALSTIAISDRISVYTKPEFLCTHTQSGSGLPTFSQSWRLHIRWRCLFTWCRLQPNDTWKFAFTVHSSANARIRTRSTWGFGKRH